MAETAADIIAQTQAWLQTAVIGLNLCPFANAVYAKKQIRYVVSDAVSEEDLTADLERESKYLAGVMAEQIETTLLIHPHVLVDFYDYNRFLRKADGLIQKLNLQGVLQIASFHPGYQFADSGPDDIENYTNRSPFPILHLLREASVTAAMESYPDTDGIVEKNKKTMSRLGLAGWQKLMQNTGFKKIQNPH